MKHIKNNLIFLISIFILFSACKTTAIEEKEDDTSLNSIGDVKEYWKNALDLSTIENIDSLYELYKDNTDFTLEDWKRNKRDGFRWTGDGFIKYLEGGSALGPFLNTLDAITIYPNPTNSFVTIILFKNIPSGRTQDGVIVPSVYELYNLQRYFPFAVSLQLILDEKIVWTHHIPNCNGEIVIEESVLQKAGNYQLVVEMDGYTASKNFMVIKKQ